MNAHSIDLLRRVRERAPLVHNITNYVVMNNTANALLALGASPVMAHAEDEVEDMVGIASALVLNIGTLSAPWIAAMKRAARAASRAGKPIALDPVGAGATDFRTRTVEELLRTAMPTVIRGNASEIMAVASGWGGTKGVDSADPAEAAVASAARLAERTGAVIVVSGAVDYIVANGRMAENDRGHPLMGRVTGMGCTATAVIGAFLGVEPDDPFAAAEAAMAIMGAAGEKAAETARGPGSFQVAFLDALALPESELR